MITPQMLPFDAGTHGAAASDAGVLAPAEDRLRPPPLPPLPRASVTGTPPAAATRAATLSKAAAAAGLLPVLGAGIDFSAPHGTL